MNPTGTTGLTSHQYGLERLVHRAQECLQSRSTNLIDAAICGSAGQSPMTSAFQKYLALTPADYRRNW